MLSGIESDDKGKKCAHKTLGTRFVCFVLGLYLVHGESCACMHHWPRVEQFICKQAWHGALTWHQNIALKRAPAGGPFRVTGRQGSAHGSAQRKELLSRRKGCAAAAGTANCCCT